MAQYRGTIQGYRGMASRVGGKKSGLVTTCYGWNLGARCHIGYNEDAGEDELHITINGGSGYGGDTINFTITQSELGKINLQKTNN